MKICRIVFLIFICLCFCLGSSFAAADKAPKDKAGVDLKASQDKPGAEVAASKDKPNLEAGLKKDTSKDANKKDKSAFKRFEFAYESQWLHGNYWEDQWRAAGGSNASLNWKLRTRLDVYKGAFYITPKTDIEGSFGVGHIAKNLPGWISDFGTAAPLDVTGETIQIWNLDLRQNIYTHENSGLALDLLLGYMNYRERLRTKDDSSDPWLTFHREYQGIRLGTKLKVPFALPKMKKKMFALKGIFFYAPNLSMKSTGDDWAWGAGSSALSNKGKGTALETHAGLTFEPIQNLSIDIMYNYLEFTQKCSGYYERGGIVGLSLHKTKTKLCGPSVAITCKF